MDKINAIKTIMSELDIPDTNENAKLISEKLFLLKPLISKELETSNICKLLNELGIETLGNFDEEDAKITNMIDQIFKGVTSFNNAELDLLNRFNKLKSKIESLIEDVASNKISNASKDAILKEVKQSFFAEARLHSLKGDIYPFCLGGSDTAAVVGVSPWTSPMKLYYQKTGQLKEEKLTKAKELTFAIGHEFEAPARNLFTLITDLPTKEFPIQVRNKKYPHIVANIDGLVFEDDQMGIYEGKCTHYKSGTYSSFEEDICPEYYLSQIQLYMEIWDVDFCYINCIWGIHEDKMKYIRIPRDREYGEMICQACEKFVQDAVLGLKPKTQAQDPGLTAKDLLEILGPPINNVNPVILGHEARAASVRLVEIKNEKNKIETESSEYTSKLKALEKEEKNILNSFIAYMQNKSNGLVNVNGEDYIIQYTADEKSSFDASVKAKFKEAYPDIYDWVMHLKVKCEPKVTFVSTSEKESKGKRKRLK